MDVAAIWAGRWGRIAGATLLLCLLLLLLPVQVQQPDRPPAAAPSTQPFFFGFGPGSASGLAAVADPDSGPRTLLYLAADAERALAADPTSRPAAYSRALALDRLHLPSVTRTAWEAVIDLAPGSTQASEARHRLAVLDRAESPDARWETDRELLLRAVEIADEETAARLVDRHRQRVRQWIEDDLLAEWATGWLAADEPSAQGSLSTARSLAAHLAHLTGDSLTADAVAVIDGASTADRARLADAHDLYGQARRLFVEQSYEAAVPLLGRAADGLAAAGSPFEGWARLYGAVCLYHLTDHSNALAVLQDLGTWLEPSRHPILEGYVHWILALVRGRTGPSAIALPDCELARERFAAAGELDNVIAIQNLAAVILIQTGDLDRAWDILEQNLRERARLGMSRHSENLLGATMDALRAQGEPAAALPLADELVTEAEARGNPTGLSLALRKRGELLIDLGADEETVDANFDAVVAAADRIVDEGHRTVVRSETLIARGKYRCGNDPVRGLDDLRRAEAFVRASAHRHLLIQVLSERARCRRAHGDRHGAELDLERALAELEVQRPLILDPRYRTFYVDHARTVQELRVVLALEQDELDEAFAVVERLRAPVLLDTLTQPVPPPNAAELVRCLPPGASLVELVTLDSEVIAWVLDERGSTTVRIPISRDDLSKDVQRFRGALVAGRLPAKSAIQKRLLDRLLPELQDARSIIIVPDGPLHDLPFAALPDPETGRPLGERIAMAQVPSARAYCALENRARRVGGDRPRSVLAVGGVPFARHLFPGLEPLPGSAEEARRTMASYPAGTTLLGTEATVERFLEMAGRYDVVHVATHAVASPGHTTSATLLLAPTVDRRSDGILPAEAIRFDGEVATRVAVLAACRTASGRISASEGPLSLARPFLAAGIPTVVATLWELDDQTSIVFSERFHTALAGGASPLDAFHSAQLALIHHPDPSLRSPRNWAGLVLIGATGEAGGT